MAAVAVVVLVKLEPMLLLELLYVLVLVEMDLQMIL